MPRKIILIRHGETDHNRQGIWQGWTDTPLNKKGLKQAEELAKHLKSEVIDAIFTSDFKRASQTAKAIAEKLGIKPIKTKKLRERNLGKIEGMLRKKSEEDHRDLLHKMFDYTDDTWSEHGGESLRELKTRVNKFLKKIKMDYKDKIIAIVTHGGTKRMLIRNLVKDAPEEESKLDKTGVKIDNAGVTVLKKDRQGAYHLTMISDTSHLENET